MKKLLIVSVILTFLYLGAISIQLPAQLLALLLVGLIPYTQISLPPLMMFFVWALLPALLFFTVQIVKGLYTLVLLLFEQAEYAAYAYTSNKSTSRTRSRKKNTARQPTPFWHIQHLRRLFHHAQAKTSTYIKPEQPKVKITKLNNVS